MASRILDKWNQTVLLHGEDKPRKLDVTHVYVNKGRTTGRAVIKRLVSGVRESVKVVAFNGVWREDI